MATDKVTVVVLEGTKIHSVQEISKEDIDKTVAAHVLAIQEGEKPGIIKRAAGAVAGGVTTGTKAAVIGAEKSAETVGGFFKAIGDGIKDAAAEYDHKQALKKQLKEELKSRETEVAATSASEAAAKAESKK